MINTLGIIQARTGSTRLPNKMLKKINGSMLIEWVIKRAKKAKKIDKIILATTTEEKDLRLVKIAKKNKIGFFRGSNKDVLTRFYKASLRYKSKKIIRICADNPFIDFEFLNSLVSKFIPKKYEYAFNHQSKFRYKCIDGFGAEIFTFDLLNKIYQKNINIRLREHVTAFIWQNFKKFKIQFIRPQKKFVNLNFKFDIDTQEDLDNLRKFVKKAKIKLHSSASKIISERVIYNHKNQYNKLF